MDGLCIVGGFLLSGNYDYLWFSCFYFTFFPSKSSIVTAFLSRKVPCRRDQRGFFYPKVLYHPDDEDCFFAENPVLRDNYGCFFVKKPMSSQSRLSKSFIGACQYFYQNPKVRIRGHTRVGAVGQLPKVLSSKTLLPKCV